MRVLQIGAGRFGRSHLRCWRELGVELAVCDTDPAALAGLDVPTASDPRPLLDAADAVDVVTPAASHAALVREALEAGKDVLVEKPFAPESGEAFELDALARRRGAILQVGHVFRFSPPARALAAALAAGRIGTPRYLAGHFCAFKRPRSDGGAALSDAIHWVDLVAWLLGEPPTAVTANLGETLGRGLDDVALLTLHFGDRLTRIEAGHLAPEPRRDLLAVGDAGALACDFLAGELRFFGDTHRRDAGGAWQAVTGARETLPVGGAEPLRAQLEAFVRACRSRRLEAGAAGGWDGAAAVAVIEACQRSSAEGRRVEIKLPAPARGEAR
jgi:UDP-2-acetamido-3-amino-2,3-dideoxy-glucuronate N-acetyltransferase